MSFDLFIRAGGYWSTNDQYLGGETNTVGLVSADSFKLSSVLMLLVEHLGYEENMKKVAWFPPEAPEEKEDIDNDDALHKVIHYAVGSGALTLFVVREDDPYIDRHIDYNAMRYLSEDDIEEVLVDAEAENDGGSGSESDDDGGENQLEDMVYSSSDDDSPHVEVDETKYRKFCIGDQYNSIESFKGAVNRYAVKKRKDIKYEKSDAKRVVAICSVKKCPWRISVSINSICNRVVIRSLQEEHNCTWQGKVSLLTNSRITNYQVDQERQLLQRHLLHQLQLLNLVWEVKIKIFQAFHLHSQKNVLADLGKLRLMVHHLPNQLLRDNLCMMQGP